MSSDIEVIIDERRCYNHEYGGSQHVNAFRDGVLFLEHTLQLSSQFALSLRHHLQQLLALHRRLQLKAAVLHLPCVHTSLELLVCDISGDPSMIIFGKGVHFFHWRSLRRDMEKEEEIIVDVLRLGIEVEGIKEEFELSTSWGWHLGHIWLSGLSMILGGAPILHFYQNRLQDGRATSLLLTVWEREMSFIVIDLVSRKIFLIAWVELLTQVYWLLRLHGAEIVYPYIWYPLAQWSTTLAPQNQEVLSSVEVPAPMRW
jgi:hypothetical protein